MIVYPALDPKSFDVGFVFWVTNSTSKLLGPTCRAGDSTVTGVMKDGQNLGISVQESVILL